MTGKTTNTVRSGDGGKRTKEYATVSETLFGLSQKTMYGPVPATTVESLEVRVDLPEAWARKVCRRDEEVVAMRTGEVLLRSGGPLGVPEGELDCAVPREQERSAVRVVVQYDGQGVHPDRGRIRIRL